MKNYLLLISVFCLTLFTSCVDNNYDLKNVDETRFLPVEDFVIPFKTNEFHLMNQGKTFEEIKALPSGSTVEIKFDKQWDHWENDITDGLSVYSAVATTTVTNYLPTDVYVRIELFSHDGGVLRTKDSQLVKIEKSDDPTTGKKQVVSVTLDEYVQSDFDGYLGKPVFTDVAGMKIIAHGISTSDAFVSAQQLTITMKDMNLKINGYYEK